MSSLSAITHLNNISLVVGLFPEFRNGHLGGIQASASTAWEAVVAKSQVTLVSYEKPHCISPLHWAASGSSVRVILSVIRQTKRPDLLLVWHVGMLKLLPLFRTQPGSVVAFLHGVEIWKRPDWFTQHLLKRVDLFLTNSDYTWERFLSCSP